MVAGPSRGNRSKANAFAKRLSHCAPRLDSRNDNWQKNSNASAVLLVVWSWVSAALMSSSFLGCAEPVTPTRSNVLLT
jgi:hypothetical protein